MLTFILAIAAGCGVFAAAYCAADWDAVWSVVAGVAGFAAVQGGVGFALMKRVKREAEQVQAILAEGQKNLQIKMQRWQMRPPSSIKAAQKEMMDDTRAFVQTALKATESMSRYRLWIPLIERQKATTQLQLNWMIKDFKAVDALMPKALMVDPTMAAMKMARMYMLEAKTADIEKVYRKGVARLRYNQNVLLAATWSWILVKRGLVDDAFKALTEALKSSDNEALKRNHEALMNNRPAHFTNSGIGDMWYSLHLEEPKVRTQRQRPVYR